MEIPPRAAVRVRCDAPSRCWGCVAPGGPIGLKIYEWMLGPTAARTNPWARPTTPGPSPPCCAGTVWPARSAGPSHRCARSPARWRRRGSPSSAPFTSRPWSSPPMPGPGSPPAPEWLWSPDGRGCPTRSLALPTPTPPALRWWWSTTAGSRATEATPATVSTTGPWCGRSPRRRRRLDRPVLPAALGWACEAANRGAPGAGAGSRSSARRRPPVVVAGLPAPWPLSRTRPLEEIAELLRRAERPVVVAGETCTGPGRRARLRRFAEGLGVPVVMKRMGRGRCPPTTTWPCPGPAERLRGADLVVVAGAPLDFRLGYGRLRGPRRGWTPGQGGAPRPTPRASRHPGLELAGERAAGDLGLTLNERPAGRGSGGAAPPAGGDRLRDGGARDLRRPEDPEFRGRGRPRRLSDARATAASPPPLRRAAPGPGPRRRRDRRRRRLRLLRRPVSSSLHAGHLARPGAVRLPRHRPGLRHRRPAGPARPPGRASCWATARPGSRSWTWTRWSATTCRW